jgi:hypothetical protein
LKISRRCQLFIRITSKKIGAYFNIPSSSRFNSNFYRRCPAEN